MIKLNEIEFGYSKKGKLFDNLSLSAEKGKVYGLLGQNGAGKTTLLKLMAGLRFPAKGDILINGIDAQKRSVDYLSLFYYIPEEFNLPSLSTQKFVEIYSAFYSNFDAQIFNDCLVEFKIPEVKNVNKMSYGQKKKLLLSFGFASNTAILFLDEPTNGLDIPSKSTFRKLIAKYINEDRIFFISTHQVKDIEGIIDDIVIIDNGKIVLNKSIENISSKLVFKQNCQIVDDSVLYSIQSGLGYNLINAKTDNEDTSNIDIELLFNAVIQKNNKVINQLNQ